MITGMLRDRGERIQGFKPLESLDLGGLHCLEFFSLEIVGILEGETKQGNSNQVSSLEQWAWELKAMRGDFIPIYSFNLGYHFCLHSTGQESPLKGDSSPCMC